MPLNKFVGAPTGVALLLILAAVAAAGSADPVGGCHVSLLQRSAALIPKAKAGMKKRARASKKRRLLQNAKPKRHVRKVNGSAPKPGLSLEQSKHAQDNVQDHSQDNVQSSHVRLTAPADDVNADICGARLVTPQLQFQIELYRSLGVMQSHYALCRVPSATDSLFLYETFMSTSANESDFIGMSSADMDRQDALLGYVGAYWPREAQSRRAWVFVLFWATGVVCTIGTFMMSAKMRMQPSKLSKGHSACQKTSFGFALSWLDPIMSMFRSKGAQSVDAKTMNALRPDLHFEPEEALKTAWAAEVATKGLGEADLAAVLWRFVGARAVLTIFGAVGLAMMLELAGMTVVLDLLLNYLRWASDMQAENPSMRLETLKPSFMVVILGFGFPMLARYFSVLGSVQDGYSTSRISAGLLALIYEKAQSLPATGMRGHVKTDVTQLVSGDLTKVWAMALKSYAQVVFAPICTIVYCGLLVNRLGLSAVLGFCASASACSLYVPVRNLVRRQNMRWFCLSDVRSRLLKDLIGNLRGLQGMSSQERVVERVLEVRDRELQTKLDHSVVLSLMTVPVTLFPFVLVCSTLFFHLCIHSSDGVGIEAQDIFVCMQVLSGAVACCAFFGLAMQRVINLPNSVRRCQRFLREPEHVQKAAQERSRHTAAPVVTVNGSFAFAPNRPAVLHDLDLSVQKGELLAVVGECASGKSALLSTMLGEMTAASAGAHVDAPEHVAYGSQKPWMVDGLLHDNVALGEAPQRARYQSALAAAHLSVAPAAASTGTTAPSPGQGATTFPYFFLWNFSASVAVLLGILNIDWAKTPLLWGILLVTLQGVLHWSVIEIPLQTIATLFVKKSSPARANADHLTCCLNYNLLAVSRADVELCFENMFDAYMGSISHKVSAVLVSATNDPQLKEYELQVRDSYRERIFNTLVQEGLIWAGLEQGVVDPDRLERIWSKYNGLDKQEFAQSQLNPLCMHFANEFMVAHRVSRVLRKCGQYQDLMLLSEGIDKAFSYCDRSLYGDMGRPLGEDLFHASADVQNIKGRNFDYTLVLDADTRVSPNSVFSLLEVGAANPDRAIVQPAIQMDCRAGDSVFTHVEAMRQAINAPLTDALTTILGESGFYGKGLLKNKRYIEQCIGTPDKPIEVVPIDVLSHDTFEAVVVRPMFVGDVALLEAPCANYVTWDIRERRWNRGEILLATYFFQRAVGTPMRILQRLCQGSYFQRTYVRTQPEPIGNSTYLAHSAIRQMILKPALVSYIVFMDFVQMHNAWAPILIIMFLIIVFPKLASIKTTNFRAVTLETIASVLQFTPEAMVGTIRVLRALKAHITGNARWIPQRAVEDEFERSNPFVFSFSYLWYYPLFAMTASLLVTVLMPDAIYVMWMLGTLVTLPFYAGFTALRSTPRHSKFPYFFMWNALTLVSLVLGVVNIKWEKVNATMGIIVVVIQGILHWSVMEIPLQTIATLFCSNPPSPAKAKATHLKACLNYNLLAVGHAEVDACMENMFEAFMGNISHNVAACLVSATNDPCLKKYELEVRDRCRERIFEQLRVEGMAWAGFRSGPVDEGRHRRVWSQYNRIDRHEFVDKYLPKICAGFAQDFMVLHRVSRVLRKCGQYQDLMLLSAGHSKAFTYCSQELYKGLARPLGELLFVPSSDADNMCGRGFDYTLVLDADTSVEPNSVFDMLEVGAGNPERAIIQPAIQMCCSAGDSFFSHVEAMRQVLTERLTGTLTGILGESGFYGKGLIKNSLYIERCLGTPEKLVEVVPVDILSHDTFEAAVLRPLYAGDIILKEAPCGNYVTWDIRERRWNRGELVLAMYFFPRWFGTPVRWLQTALQGKEFEQTKVRTKVELSQVTSYIAHAALRQLMVKPILVMYIILMDFVEMHYEWTPLLVAMFLIIVFPKLVTCTEGKLKAIVLETLTSMLQFTPECVVGTIRVLRALRAHLTGNARWVPQRAVEEEFERNNPFFFTLTYLWYYPCFASISGLMVSALIPDGSFIMWMLGTLFTLPLYAGFTAVRTPKAPTKAWHEDALAASLEAGPQSLDAVDGASESAAWLEKVPIGIMGSHLSASERAQVAFARAAYQDKANLVVLDDPLASMDAATAAHVLEQLASNPLFKGRTRVVSMPIGSVESLERFDRVVVLEAGRIAAQGSPKELLAEPALRAKFDEGATQERSEQGTGRVEAKAIARVEDTVPEAVDAEESEGQANYWRSCLDAMLAGGPGRLALAAALVLLLRIVVTLQILLLGIWADQQEMHEQHAASDDARYIRMLGTLVILAGMAQAMQNYFVLTFSNAISQSLFRQLLDNFLRAPMGSFWDRQPAGRLLNRMSGDVMTIDSTLSTGCLALISFAFSVFVQQVYCLYILPKWIALPMYVAIGSFAYFCFTASTPLQYASIFALSNCHEDQLQAVTSQDSARAYGLQPAQVARYREKASAAVKPNFFGTVCAKQWLVLRITFCFCFQCTVCMLAGILRPGSAHSHIATLAMIALLTFNIVQELDGIVESVIGSIGVGLALGRLSEHPSPTAASAEERRALRERVHEALHAGAGLRVHGLRVRSSPAISGDLSQGTWVGLAGGAASPFLQTLAGLDEAAEGTAALGCVALAGVGRVDASVAAELVRYIPQEPAVFEGSVRFNVDPSGEASDDRVRKAMDVAQLPADLDLNAEVSWDSFTLSHGQRQLLSLARAVLEEPAVLLLDSSLSLVDSRTRRGAYNALATALPKTIVMVGSLDLDPAAHFDKTFDLATRGGGEAGAATGAVAEDAVWDMDWATVTTGDASAEAAPPIFRPAPVESP